MHHFSFSILHIKIKLNYIESKSYNNKADKAVQASGRRITIYGTICFYPGLDLINGIIMIIIKCP